MSLLNLLRKEPKTCDLLRIFIQAEAACYWKTIGRALEVQVNDLIGSPNCTADNLGFVFERWRQKYKDVTWERIIQVCEDYEYGRVCHAIMKFLSSHKAHEEYQNEADFDCTCNESMMIHKESKKNGNDYSNKTVCRLLKILIILIVIVIIIGIFLCYLIYQKWTCCKC